MSQKVKDYGILILLAVNAFVIYLAFVKEIASETGANEAVAMQKEIIDKARAENENLKAEISVLSRRIDSAEAEILIYHEKLQYEKRKLKNLETEFKALPDKVRDSILLAYIMANQ